jgi:putative ABC transport system ATP-binding protein
VICAGRDLVKVGERELTGFRRHFVGFVFQFYNLIPSLTARENVAVVTEIANNPMRPRALALVGLGERLDHFPAQLSGGEQQRVAIARAVAKQPAGAPCATSPPARSTRRPGRGAGGAGAVNRELGTTTAVITHNAGDRGHGRPGDPLPGRPDRQDRQQRARKAPRELHW